MKNNNSAQKVTQEVIKRGPTNKALKRLRHNLEELSALLDSNYKIYLNPKIISRMKELLEDRSY